MTARPASLRRLLLVGAAALAVGAGGAAFWLRSGPSGADPNDVAQVALGRAVYAQHCAQCHGAKLEGQANWRQRLPTGRLPAPPHDESGHTWHHADAQLFGITKHGLGPYAPPGYESDMPGFASALSDAEIWAVLAFIKSSWPPEIRARQDSINRQAAR